MHRKPREVLWVGDVRAPTLPGEASKPLRAAVASYRRYRQRVVEPTIVELTT